MPVIKLLQNSATNQRILTPSQVSVKNETVPIKELYEVEHPFKNKTEIIAVKQNPHYFVPPKPLEIIRVEPRQVTPPPTLVLSKPVRYEPVVKQPIQTTIGPKNSKSNCCCDGFSIPIWAWILLALLLLLLIGLLATFMAFSPWLNSSIKTTVNKYVYGTKTFSKNRNLTVYYYVNDGPCDNSSTTQLVTTQIITSTLSLTTNTNGIVSTSTNLPSTSTTTLIPCSQTTTRMVIVEDKYYESNSVQQYNKAYNTMSNIYLLSFILFILLLF